MLSRFKYYYYFYLVGKLLIDRRNWQNKYSIFLYVSPEINDVLLFPVTLVQPEPYEFDILLTNIFTLPKQCFISRFKPVIGGADVEVIKCWENTVIFIISAFQYLNMACVYAKGWPFRQKFSSNCK